MLHRPLARRLVLCLGLLVLIAGVVTLSVEARAWVDTSQHHLAKHYKIADGAACVDAVVERPAAGLARLTVLAAEPLPAPSEFLTGREPHLRSHLLRSPPAFLAWL